MVTIVPRVLLQHAHNYSQNARKVGMQFNIRYVK